MAIKKQPYHETLRQMIRDAGKELEKIADQMVPDNLDHRTDFYITITFDQEFGSVPEISWTTNKICTTTMKRLEED